MLRINAAIFIDPYMHVNVLLIITANVINKIYTILMIILLLID